MSEADRINGISALELTMRDVLGGMEELANGLAWQASGWDTIEVVRTVQPATTGPVRRPPLPRPVLVHNRPARRVA